MWKYYRAIMFDRTSPMFMPRGDRVAHGFMAMREWCVLVRCCEHLTPRHAARCLAPLRNWLAS